MSSLQEFVLITGASSGMGKEVAIRLSQNYRLILCGRNLENLETTKDECLNPESHLIFQCDLNDLQLIEKSLQDFISTHDIKIHYFVHSAGITLAQPFSLTSVDSMSRMFNANTFSAVLILKLLTAKRGNGKSLKSAVFVSSNVSNFGAYAFCSYAASKSALDSFMKSAAMELAPLVRVNSVLPGITKTPMTESLFDDDDFMSKINKAYPMGTPSTNDIADVIEFLLSDKSKMITGQQIVVDGGRTTLFKKLEMKSSEFIIREPKSIPFSGVDQTLSGGAKDHKMNVIFLCA